MMSTGPSVKEAVTVIGYVPGGVDGEVLMTTSKESWPGALKNGPGRLVGFVEQVAPAGRTPQSMVTKVTATLVGMLNVIVL